MSDDVNGFRIGATVEVRVGRSELLDPIPPPTAELEAEWQAWLAGRPERVRAVAERLPPWITYRLKTTGQCCRVIGYHEGRLGCDEVACNDTCARPRGHAGEHHPDGDVTAYIYAEHPELGAVTGRRVFGIEPETLEPWDS